jgi:hypothetical protein
METRREAGPPRHNYEAPIFRRRRGLSGQRAQVTASYFICGFAHALPVIGVGVVATLATPTVASICFGADQHILRCRVRAKHQAWAVDHGDCLLSSDQLQANHPVDQ